jgi:hypothetical protein
MKMVDRHYCTMYLVLINQCMVTYFPDIGRAINHLADYAVHKCTMYSDTLRNLLANIETFT